MFQRPSGTRSEELEHGASDSLTLADGRQEQEACHAESQQNTRVHDDPGIVGVRPRTEVVHKRTVTAVGRRGDHLNGSKEPTYQCAAMATGLTSSYTPLL